MTDRSAPPRSGASGRGTRKYGNANRCMTKSVVAVKSTSRGFTLIELMIVVVIVGVLAMIAYPSYLKYIVRTSREAAQSQLLELSTVEEKIFLNSNAYTGSVTGAYTGNAAGGLGVTSGKSNDGKYNINAAAATNTFTLTASPIGGSTQAGDGDITINQSGARVWGSTTW
jgi:type IV pilus assembly protein PilE